ncbi:MAG: sensor histidine kinase, partial [Anaerolineae bacterium]|nr:sensor histidine kinase [Anaerolineae bacterium]
FTLEDNGRGFDHNIIGDTQKRGVGLLGIQERVELIGGTLTIDSVAGRGTRLIVNAPIQERLAAV